MKLTKRAYTRNHVKFEVSSQNKLQVLRNNQAKKENVLIKLASRKTLHCNDIRDYNFSMKIN